ncbi:Spx/MgsR family RNA polymerase-binding regulatory protein [Orrella sp. 11846]|uniref:Spx/MgsR family RNA polymerase-binding regulatory protein n=1 Tax=Orrella sp. 11846 TaxID=3409913 RepID=UPI003B5AEA87
MIQVYGLTKCSTCIKALDWLKAQSIDFEFTDYRDHPIEPQDLVRYAEILGGWEKLVNRASMTWRQLDDSQKSASTEAQWLSLIAEYPTLIRRPLVVSPDGRVTNRFNLKRWQAFFDVQAS